MSYQSNRGRTNRSKQIQFTAIHGELCIVEYELLLMPIQIFSIKFDFFCKI